MQPEIIENAFMKTNTISIQPKPNHNRKLGTNKKRNTWSTQHYIPNKYQKPPTTNMGPQKIRIRNTRRKTKIPTTQTRTQQCTKALRKIDKQITQISKRIKLTKILHAWKQATKYLQREKQHILYAKEPIIDITMARRTKRNQYENTRIALYYPKQESTKHKKS